MRRVYLFIIILTISSCSNSRKIEGLWIGTGYSWESGMIYIPGKDKLFNYIVEIKHDSLSYANLLTFKDKSKFSAPVNIRNHRLKDIKVHFDTNLFHLTYFKGEMKFLTPHLTSRFVYLARIPYEYKTKYDCNKYLNGNFIWTSDNHSDYFRVVADSLVGFADSLNGSYKNYRANIFRYEGLNFVSLISLNNVYITYLLNGCDENELKLIRPKDLRLSKSDTVFLTPIKAN
jgi:hypothetical protein